MLNEHEQTNF